MNILLTGSCSIACPYCFAESFLEEQPPRKRMALHDYKRILAFLSRSDVKEIQLAGGEPTLHPGFEEFLDYAIVEGFLVTVLSNGLFGQRVRDHLHGRRGHFRLLCLNVNEPAFYPRKQWELIRANLALLGSKAALGVNIYRPDQDLQYVLDLAREFGVKGLRCVFAHQSGRAPNPAIMRYDAFPSQAERLADLVERAGRELGIRVGYDCGFVPCLFTDRQLGVFSRWRTQLGQCSKLALSIDSELRIAHCFNRERSDHVAHLDGFQTMSDVETFFSNLDRNEPPLFDACEACEERRVGACDGGCIADRRVLGSAGPRPTLRVPGSAAEPAGRR